MADRLIVISPHLDDAVFGCGQLVASKRGALVVTIFAGVPQDASLLTEWDAACGFGSAAEAMHARWREDDEAIACLDAEALRLDCIDSQYRNGEPVPDLLFKLAHALPRDGATIAIPLGLFHSDHELAHRAALDLFASDREREWLAYEEPMYRRIPGLVADRLQKLHAKKIRTQQLATEERYGVKKKAALECYQSQLRGLASARRPGHADALAPERYWRLS